MSQPLSVDHVRALARTAGLELTADGLEACAALLGDWLPAANELSAAMSKAEHNTVMPITALVHPHMAEKGE